MFRSLSIDDKTGETQTCAWKKINSNERNVEFYFRTSTNGFLVFSLENVCSFSILRMLQRSLPIIIKCGPEETPLFERPELIFLLFPALFLLSFSSHTTENEDLISECDVCLFVEPTEKVVRDEKQILDRSHIGNK